MSAQFIEIEGKQVVVISADDYRVLLEKAEMLDDVAAYDRAKAALAAALSASFVQQVAQSAGVKAVAGVLLLGGELGDAIGDTGLGWMPLIDRKIAGRAVHRSSRRNEHDLWDPSVHHAGEQLQGGHQVAFDVVHHVFVGVSRDRGRDQMQDHIDAVQHDNFGVLYHTSHGHMCAVVGARHNGERETLAGGQVELIDRLDGRINHIHLIDSDNTCHKDANGDDETSMHLPFGEGVVEFDPILDRLAKVDTGHDWWTIDLCFWPDAWDATERCKSWLDGVLAARSN